MVPSQWTSTWTHELYTPPPEVAASRRRNTDGRPVELELLQAFADVIERSVTPLLHRCPLELIWVPSAAELLHRADIDEAVVQVRHESGAELVQKTFVHVDSVSCEDAFPLRHMFLELEERWSCLSLVGQ